MKAGGNLQRFILCVLDVSVVGVAYVCAPTGATWLMIDLSTALCAIINVSFCCPQDVPAKALRILLLLDTLSATWLL